MNLFHAFAGGRWRFAIALWRRHRFDGRVQIVGGCAGIGLSGGEIVRLRLGRIGSNDCGLDGAGRRLRNSSGRGLRNCVGRCRGNHGGRRDRLNGASRGIGRQCGWRRTVGWLALAHRFGVIADLGLLADLGISLHLAVAEGFAIDAGRNGAGRIAGIGGIGCFGGTGGLGVAAGLRRFRVFGLGRWLGRILLRGACGLVGSRRQAIAGAVGQGPACRRRSSFRTASHSHGRSSAPPALGSAA
jgi:hypothetical protein